MHVDSQGRAEKKDGGEAMSIKLKNGRYVLRYYANGTKGSKQLQETLPKGVSYQDAKNTHALRLATAAARHGQPIAGRITFKELSALYIADQGASMSGTGRERTEAMLKNHLLPVFGHVTVSTIKATHVRQYQRNRVANGAEPSTVNREWNTFRAILNFGEKEEIIDRNPVRRGAVKLLPTKGSRKDFFEPEEWRAFVAAFDDDARWKQHLAKIRNLGEIRVGEDGRAYGIGSRKPDSDISREYLQRLREAVPFFRALLFTGARVGELITLTWADVDLRRGVVTLHQHKTGKEKSLPIAPALREILKAIPQGVGRTTVFRRPNGHAFEIRQVQRAFFVTLKLAGITKPLSVHSIRHTVGSWLTIAGAPERHVAEILGHAQRSVTSGYSHLAQGSLAPVLATLERIEREGFAASESGVAIEGGNEA
jgi:integrase